MRIKKIKQRPYRCPEYGMTANIDGENTYIKIYGRDYIMVCDSFTKQELFFMIDSSIDENNRRIDKLIAEIESWKKLREEVEEGME
jgi:hypothetical protein